jgi:hypothetical protein
MKTKTIWAASDVSRPVELSRSSLRRKTNIIEFKDNKNEWHDFCVVVTPKRIVFGGACNTGFLESGFIEINDFETLHECLDELFQDLQTYYNDGPEFVSRIVCNDRM